MYEGLILIQKETAVNSDRVVLKECRDVTAVEKFFKTSYDSYPWDIEQQTTGIRRDVYSGEFEE